MIYTFSFTSSNLLPKHRPEKSRGSCSPCADRSDFLEFLVTFCFKTKSNSGLGQRPIYKMKKKDIALFFYCKQIH